jgi:hypothetical protein
MANIKDKNKKSPKKNTPKKKKTPKPKSYNKSHSILVWNTYIGKHVRISNCMCCNIREISSDVFDIGHVLAKANGGDASIANLRPICNPCNTSMKTEDMVEYKKRLVYAFPDNWNGINNDPVIEDKVAIVPGPVIEDKVAIIPAPVIDIENIPEIFTKKKRKDCESCGKVFASTSLLKRHIDKKFPCTPRSKACIYCNAIFSTLGSLQRHIKTEICLQEGEPYYKFQRLTPTEREIQMKIYEKEKEIKELQKLQQLIV